MRIVKVEFCGAVKTGFLSLLLLSERFDAVLAFFPPSAIKIGALPV